MYTIILFSIVLPTDNVWFNKPMKPMIDGFRLGHNHFKSRTGKSFTVGYEKNLCELTKK